ncbi:restriction endonuclease subunit S [Neisseria meningitidis]|uniref:restriction endonuclease subunit S n=1 Tax=Neisseria meningitidis TaxID=487 RepID=UPI00197C1FDE|nr:restriction endonuclease subunit S [Neisseria meningitidis]
MDMQNKAKKLIEMIQTAPVEWKLLTEVADLTRGRVISKGYLADNLGNYPVYSSQTLNNGEIGKINSFDFDGEFVSWTTDGANAGTVFYRSGKFSITNVCGLIKIKNILELNYKFLFYWLSIEAKKHVYSGMGNPKLMSHQMGKIQIPIPPLEIQQEIVKILDKFTELEATLEAELTLRKRQYQYYRDFLLDFDNQIGGIADDYKGRLKNVVWKTLGEVSDINVGKSPETNEIGNYPLINAGTIPSGYIASYNTEPDTITTPSRGQGGIGYVGYQTSKFWCGPLCYRIRGNNNLIMTKFLYYVMSKDMSKIINLANMAGIPALNKKDLVNFLIPIPPLAEQEKIVAILDKFDTLTHSISEGLPHEIALRRKQYEYYREQLLAFPKAT